MKDDVAATDVTDEIQESESVNLDLNPKSSMEALSERNSSFDNIHNSTNDTLQSINSPDHTKNIQEQVVDKPSESRSVEEVKDKNLSLDQHVAKDDNDMLAQRDLENQVLIARLKERIAELELRGEGLQEDKEKLEVRICNVHSCIPYIIV